MNVGPNIVDKRRRYVVPKYANRVYAMIIVISESLSPLSPSPLGVVFLGVVATVIIIPSPLQNRHCGLIALPRPNRYCPRTIAKPRK